MLVTAGWRLWMGARKGLMVSAIEACIIVEYRVSKKPVTEIPTLDPMLRIRLKKAGPCVRERGGRVANVEVLSGTNTRPRPRPCTIPVRIMAEVGTSGVKRDI